MLDLAPVLLVICLRDSSHKTIFAIIHHRNKVYYIVMQGKFFSSINFLKYSYTSRRNRTLILFIVGKRLLYLQS